MPDSIGTAFVDVAFDPKQISGQLGGLGGKLEGSFKGMGGKLGLAAATGIGAAIAGGVVAGKYLYDVGKQFDDMADTIRTSTGKTGPALKTLVDTAKQVGTDVPASFKDAGTAVATLSTRLDVTGKPLRTLSDQMLELARLSGSDLPTALNSVTRMLGDAGLKGADASEGIDKLFRASQATQVPVTRLADLLTKFGGPMRQLGFSFEEQAALLGKFEKEGVNTELVMGSMRIALGKMAKAGKDPVEGLRATMQAIKDAGTAGEANAKAIELFGARAGPDMAAAIREGRFSIDDLVKTIGKGRETVLKAGKDTADFSEQWQIFKNRIAVAVAPAAEKMFAAVGKGMEELNKHWPEISKGIKDAVGPIGKDLGPALKQLGEIMVELAPAFKLLGQIAGNALRAMAGEFKAVVNIISGVVKVISALFSGDWSKAWEGMKQIAQGAIDFVKALVGGWINYFGIVLGPIKTAASNIGKAILDGLTAGVQPIVGLVTSTFSTVVSAISGAVSAVSSAAQAVGRGILTGVQTVISALAGIVTAVFNAVRAAISSATGAIASAASAVGRAILTGIQTVVSGLAALVTGYFNAARAVITGAVSLFLTAARAVGTAILTGIRTAVSTLASVVGGFINAAVGVVRNAAGAAGAAATAIGTSIVSGIRSGLAGVYAAVKGGLDAIWRGISAVAGAAAGAASAIGSAIVGGIVSGLGSLISAVGGAIASKVHGAISWAKDHIGSTADEVSKEMIGLPLAAGMVEGVVEGTAPLGDAIAKSVTTAVEKGRTQIEKSRGAFSDAFGTLGGDVLKAFDAIQGQLKTRSEQLLDKMELDRRVAEIKDRIAAARADLATAQAEQAALAPAQGESDADFQKRAEEAKAKVLAAQKALADALYEQRKFQLEAQAEQERINLDARIALRRRHLETALAAEQTAFATGKVNADKAQKDLVALLNRYGVDYRKAGLALGGSFVTGLKEQMARSMADLQRILEAIKRAIEAVTSANAGVHAPAAGGHAAVAGFASLGVSATDGGETTYGEGTMYGKRSPFAALSRSMTTAASAAAAPMQPPPTLVRVYIGDEELRGIVRTEVGFADDATARVVLAGARA